MNDLFPQVRFLRSIRYAFLLATIVGTACTVSPTIVVAQSLDNWKAALNAKGIESIPYENLRRTANEQQEIVNNLCKTEWSCDSLGTKSIRADINGLQGKINENKNTLISLNNDLSKAATDDEKRSIQEKIDKLNDATKRMSDVLADKTSRLENDLKEIDTRITKGTNCKNARLAVKQAFQDAIDKAKNESDPDIKAIANQLITYWEEGNKQHVEAAANADKGVQICQKCQTGDL
ncbi:hypothetical protein ACN4EG_12825 [Alkalinema pantanalense CENA528]|uniref:hypothetical protein n=1 Tax=Alkalinema pantanalense TaxID=1620705 RepID=UPI003D6E8235